MLFYNLMQFFHMYKKVFSSGWNIVNLTSKSFQLILICNRTIICYKIKNHIPLWGYLRQIII